MKKFILPVALFVFGAGAAFATNTATETSAAIVPGYRITANPMQPCEDAVKSCSTIPTVNLCKESGDTLHRLNGTSCGTELFEP